MYSNLMKTINQRDDPCFPKFSLLLGEDSVVWKTLTTFYGEWHRPHVLYVVKYKNNNTVKMKQIACTLIKGLKSLYF
jgi:hypothetical protein